MKIAYRTSGGSVLAVAASITKEADHMVVVAPDGGSRLVEYAVFATLTQNDVSLADYAGEAPSPFKADLSHTWNGSALVATDWQPEEQDPPIPFQSWTEFQFRRRFTQDERIAIADLKALSKPLADFDGLLECAGRSGSHIHNDDPDLLAGMDELQSAGILSKARKRKILGG